MKVDTFISNYREAFGKKSKLPLVFWYSDTAIANTEKINGCFFKELNRIWEGTPISLNEDSIGCGGGKLYTGFSDMPSHVPSFVSLKEKYKKTPKMVSDFVERLDISRTNNRFLNITSIDMVDCFDNIEALIFFATPDELSGLTTWAYFDNNSEDAVVSLFGSGCCSIITQPLIENHKNGRRTFLGLFDPSVRPHIDSNILSFAIPMSRFKEMYHTMRESCLFDTHAWGKVRQRINGNI